jgi:protein TonB
MMVTQSRAHRRATSVAVVGEKKKTEKKKEEKPKPKPKPLLASAKPEPLKQAAPKIAPKTAPEPVTPHEAPVETNIQMGNAEPGDISLGGPAQQKENTQQQGGQKQQTQKTAPVVKKEKVLAPKGDNPEEDTCTEAPTKPVPETRSTEIEYTQEARANGVEGRLVLKIVVAADGTVQSVEVVSSVDPALDAAAVAAVKTWVFKPAMRCGKPFGGASFTLARRFELGD